MQKEIEDYLKYLASQKGLSEKSIEAYKKDLNKLNKYFISESLNLENLARHEFRGFLAELDRFKLSNKSINRILAAVKGFIKYKIRFGYKDTASILEIESLKTPKYFPKFLYDDEIEQLIGFECSTKDDYRDRAIFELIFSTGMRVGEIISLNLSHLTKDNNELRIRGKGDKERFVLYGERCKKYLEEYLKTRVKFSPKDNGLTALFLNNRGERLSDRGVRYLLYKRLIKTALNKKISPHSLRHSFATALIRNGADIRSVQSLLGHSSLATTQIYTHLGLDELKDIHHKFHPHG